MPQIDLGKIVGDQGPQGPRGLQGNPGEKGETGSPGPGVAAGGAANQVLVKHSGTNFDTMWVDAGSLPIFAGVQDAVAIVADGDTHPAIADGQFVYVRNHSTLDEGLYKASEAISENGALSTSNLTADSAGGLNDLQAQANTLNDKITVTEATLADSIAIVANGDTHAAITSGQYVYVKNHGSLTDGLYKATAAIGTNATLSTSNLTADGNGGLNDLKGQVDSLNSKVTVEVIDNAHTWNSGAVDMASGKTLAITRFGRIVKIEFQCKIKTDAVNSDNGIVFLPAQYKQIILARGYVNEVSKTSSDGVVGYCGMDSWTQDGSAVNGVYVGNISKFAGKTVCGFVTYILQTDPT